jgi:hypothetical protein
MSALRDAALKLAECGFRVFPVKARTKTPLINDNINRATTGVNIVSGWWAKGQHNIAVATGIGSNVFVLDVDGDQGEETLSSLELEHGKLPTTVEVTTGNGRHLYFQYPRSGVVIRNSQCRNDIPGLDVRGNGGYVLVPPSIHPSGREYTWSAATEFADAPHWLLDIITSKGRPADKPEPVQATPPDAWVSFLSDGVDGSRRGSAVARLSGLLLRKFLDPMVTLELCRMFNRQRCNPPLADDEVTDIVGTICEREFARRRWG